MKCLPCSAEMSAVGLDHVLEDTDIPALSEVLTRICDKWKQLATALELPNFLISQCCNESLILAMNGVIRVWIAGNGAKPITLGTLKLKLESDTMGEITFAKDLVANFNKKKFPGASFPETTSPGAAPSEAAPRGHVADCASM